MNKRTCLILVCAAVFFGAAGSAFADCPDREITCNRVWPDQQRYPQSVKAMVGACDAGWDVCKFTECSNWKDSMIRACKAALKADID